MATISLPNTLVNSSVADASEVMANFTAITSGIVNGQNDMNFKALTVQSTATFLGPTTYNSSVSFVQSATYSGAVYAYSSIYAVSQNETRYYHATSGVTGFYVGVRAPTALAATYQMTWPSTAPVTGNVLKYNGTTYVHQGIGAVQGTTTNDNAAAGDVGEYIEGSASAVSLTTATLANVTSISLTAGDWSLASSLFTNAGTSTTVSLIEWAISKTSASLPGLTDGIPVSGQFQTFERANGTTVNDDKALPIPTIRVLLASTTTIYLVVRETFASGTGVTANGWLGATRIR